MSLAPDWHGPRSRTSGTRSGSAYRAGLEHISDWAAGTERKMKNAATQELFSYWNRLRGARTAPERSDIDPGAIRGVLADTFVLDVTDDGVTPLRISGARLNALFLSELKGLDFQGYWDPPSRIALRDLVSNVAAEPAPAIAGVKAAPRGRAPLDLELLLLPLRHFGKTRSRILGCLTPSAVPLWLGLVPVEALILGPMRIIRPSVSTAFGSPRPAPERHGHLRVHDGGNSRENTALHLIR